MSVSEFVDDIEWVKSCVVGDAFRNDFQRFGEHVHDKLLFTWNLNSVLFQSLWKFHFSSSSTSDDLVGLETSSDNHDGVVQWSFGFFDELLGTTSQNDCGGFGLW